MNLFNRVSCAFFIVLFITACGSNGKSKSPAELEKITLLTIQDNMCPYGGSKVETGTDSNSNQILDESEVNDVNYRCVLVLTSDIAPGEVCQLGGTYVKQGTDTNGDSKLDESEIDEEVSICKYNFLEMEEVIAVDSATCEKGGVVLTGGSDLNYNEVLDDDEVTDSQTKCNDNYPPVAVLEASMTSVTNGESVYLDYYSSYDVDDDVCCLGYEVDIIGKPAGSITSVNYDHGAELLKFTPDMSGEFIFQLIVSDNVHEDITTLTITVNPADPADYSNQILDFNISDAEFSDSLNSIVIVPEESDLLWIYNVDTESFSSIDLPLEGRVVSVSPDGLNAVVGHDAWVSYIDLENAEVIETHNIPLDIYDVVLDAKGYAYAVPDQSSDSEMYSLDLASGNFYENNVYSTYYGLKIKYHPDSGYLYGVSYDEFEKYDISEPSSVTTQYAPYNSDYFYNREIWITDDAARVFTGSGQAFYASGDDSEDMSYAGKLDENQFVVGFDSSSELGLIAALEQKKSDDYYYSYDESDMGLWKNVYFYQYDYLQYQSSIEIDPLVFDDRAYFAAGEFVFFDNDNNLWILSEVEGPDSTLSSAIQKVSVDNL